MKFLFAFRLIVLCWLFLLPKSGFAVSFLSFDPRTMAMGGSGTATAIPSQSGVFNPALLANPDLDENQMFVQAYAGIRLLDRNGFIERAENLEEKESEQNIDASVEKLTVKFEKQKVSAREIYDLTDEARGFLKDIKHLSNKPLRASASLGFSTGIQTPGISYALTQRRYMVIGSVVKIDPLDISRINHMLDTYDAIAGVMIAGDTLEEFSKKSGYERIQETIRQDAENNEVSDELRSYDDIPKVNNVIVAMENFQFEVEELDEYIDMQALYNAIESQEEAINFSGGKIGNINIEDYFRYQLPEKFNSTLNFSGAQITESFVSFANAFEKAGNVSLGVNIKYQDIETIGFKQRLNKVDFDAYKLEKNRRSYQKINFDVGASYPLSESWKTGFIAKNIIHRTLKTHSGRSIKFEPIYRVALAFENEDWTWALDLDLSENEPLGFDSNKRYLTTGVEWRPLDQHAFRAGYRYNTVTRDGMPSIGMSSGYGRVFTDFAFTASDIKTELGLAAQIRVEL